MKSLKQPFRLLIICLLSFNLLFSSCKKDEEELSPKTELLTNSAWKMTAYTVDPGFPTFDNEGNITGSTNGIFVLLDDCEKDDTHKFNTDKSLVTDEGMTRCDSSDPQKTNGTWTFNTDETTLTITEEGESQIVTILELTAGVLQLQSTESSDGMTVTFTITFSH